MVKALTPPGGTHDVTEGLRYALFMRIWGVALVAHVVANWAQPDLPSLVGVANLLVGLLAILLTFRPDRRVLLIVAAATLISLLGEMPFTGNHWLVAGLVSLAVITTGGRPQHFFSSARLILLVFYAFAAFAKLNTGFFDPSVSCAVFYANQSLASFGLPTVNPASTWALVPVWGSVLIELSVPPLLAMRRTRYIGVLLASAFHILISFDLDQHFYDFTAVLLPLFLLFLPDNSLVKFSAKVTSITSRSSRWVIHVLGAIATSLVVISVLPATGLGTQLLGLVPFWLWIPASLCWMYLLWSARGTGPPLSWKLGIAGIVVAGLAVANGLTPYTEVKTAYGFNMYANLVTASGVSNHLLVRQTAPLRDGYEGPVEIVSSSDPGLELYHDLGYLIAYPQLRRYLASHPDVSLTYIRYGETFKLNRAADDPVLIDPGPWWWRFFPLRAIDTFSPPRCQDVFMPAL